jgi:lipoprotein-anchoring transpeptidase ErfK/SrfK
VTRLRPSSILRRIGLATALLAATALVVSACGANTTGGQPQATVTQTGGGSNSSAPSSGASSSSSSSSKSAGKPKPKADPVHVSLKFGDGQTLGVGIPIIAFLSRPIKDARAFAKATRVTQNGKPVEGGWYFERKFGDPGHPIEADYRPATFWKGHSRIHLDLPVKGVSAGPGLAFDDSLTLDFTTGPANIVTVNNFTHKMTVISDGKLYGTFPVSLGASNTRTKRGVKVIMEKGRDISMRGPGYFDPHVKFTQRLTYDGEYLHAAPWNCVGQRGCVGPQNNIGKANSSNGCTNLRPQDAQKLFGFLEIGDVVKYPNADGRLMQIGDGYGDWNIPWPQWQTGGLYSVS